MASIRRLIDRAGGPKEVAVVVDVGAHDGADSLPLAERHPQVRFVAIEPTPELAEGLRRRSRHLPNYVVVEAAVGAEDGAAPLNVFDDLSKINSLNTLDAAAATQLWGRGSGEPDARPIVTVRRLSTICNELGIDVVDVLHVDTQGSDLAVLQSLDERRLRSLQAGALEVSYRLRIYDTSESGERAREVLDRLGFRIFRIERLQAVEDAEQNYYFVRQPDGAAVRLPARVEYAVHLAACELRALPPRSLAHAVRLAQRARVAAAVRTRARALFGRGSS